MRTTFVSSLLLLFGWLIVSPFPASPQQSDPGKAKPSTARLKGMKDALAGIEKGQLKQKEFALPNPAWFGDYLQLLKKECAVDWVTVDKASDEPKNPRAEIDGYNDVMRVEIEHRYGKGILEKLHEKAKAEYFTSKDKK